MYILTDQRFGQLPLPQAPCALELPRDVISERIDVFAQRALFRMLKGDPAAQADARGMICAVKTGELAGIYKEDERVPALRARKMGLGWWQLIPKGEDATVVHDPADPALAPIIVFRDSARSVPQRLDPALRRVWRRLRGEKPSSADLVIVPHPILGYVWKRESRPAESSPGFAGFAGNPPTGFIHVGDTLQSPHRWICHLQIDFGLDPRPPVSIGNRIIIKGTGLLISPRHVLTTAHCLRSHFGATHDILGNPKTPISAVEIAVTPARAGLKEQPFGQAVTNKFDVSREWDRGKALAAVKEFDYGVIALEDPIVPSPAFWGQPKTKTVLRAVPEVTLKKARLFSAGYPGHKCPPGLLHPLVCIDNGGLTVSDDARPHLGTAQWRTEGNTIAVSKRMLECDLESQSGVSGAPIWIERQGIKFLVAIHRAATVGPGGSRREGVRITADLLKEVREWLKRDGIKQFTF